jgi:hypothetical protein
MPNKKMILLKKNRHELLTKNEKVVLDDRYFKASTYL